MDIYKIKFNSHASPIKDILNGDIHALVSEKYVVSTAYTLMVA